LELVFELVLEFELLEVFELVFELLFELVLELVFELVFELVLELVLLDVFDELLPRNASFTSVSATAGIGSGAERAGRIGVAWAAPAPRMPAARMVTLYFMTRCSFALRARKIRALRVRWASLGGIARGRLVRRGGRRRREPNLKIG
jgi:hypothetical protein